MSAAPRPTYETAKDRSNESDVAAVIARAWGFTAKKLPMQYRIDFGLLDCDTVEAFLEVKDRRPYRSDSFATLILSAAKYEAGLAYSRAFGRPVFLAVRWADRLGVQIIEPRRALRLVLAGRRDRGDWQDMEPCVALDVRGFVDPASLAPSGIEGP